MVYLLQKIKINFTYLKFHSQQMYLFQFYQKIQIFCPDKEKNVFYSMIYVLNLVKLLALLVHLSRHFDNVIKHGNYSCIENNSRINILTKCN